MAHGGSCPLARQDGPLPPRPWRWECRGDNREPGLSSQDRGPEVGIGGVALAGGHISRTPTRSRARARGLPEGFPVTRLTWSRRVLRSRMRLGIDQAGFLEFRVGCSRHSARGWARFALLMLLDAESDLSLPLRQLARFSVVFVRRNPPACG